jgi:dTMP kinase
VNQKRGRLITLEGGEGAGKSTQLRVMQEWLQQQGIQSVVTREPGGTPVGEALRAIILNKDHVGIVPDTELLIMFAARAQHIQAVVEPALAAGQWVLCDRFTDATYAYQGGGRGISRDRIAALETWVQGELRPDHVFILDVPVDIGLARAGARGELDRFEREAHAFLERVRAEYLHRAATWPDRYSIVDGSQGVTQVSASLLSRLKDWV